VSGTIWVIVNGCTTHLRDTDFAILYVDAADQVFRLADTTSGWEFALV
jgi:hypothetical protein